MKFKVGMEFWIDYAHSIEGHEKCEAKHGHTARVVIEVEGNVKGGQLYRDNVVMDFDELRRICRKVLDELDHRDLNQIFDFPTTENIARYIFEKLKKRLPAELARVTVYEGEGKWATVER